jgi:SPP1 family predicted phage head-tail adaptor
MRPSIGRLRHRIALERAVRSDDGGGGANESWVKVADVWAEIRPTGGGEIVESDALTGRISHEIIMRFRTGVSPAMRLISNTRLFEIFAVIDIDERRRWIKCLCLERDL